MLFGPVAPRSSSGAAALAAAAAGCVGRTGAALDNLAALRTDSGVCAVRSPTTGWGCTLEYYSSLQISGK